MSASPPSNTQDDLQKLKTLIKDISHVIDLQRKQSHGHIELTQSVNQLTTLLTPMRRALEDLERHLAAQEKEREQLHALQDVGAVINSSLELGQVLNVVMDTIISLSGAERGFLMLVDEDTGELEVQVARNINRETIEDSTEFSRSVVDSVFDTGKPVVTTNAQLDPRFSGQQSIISYNLRSILCVPVQIKNVNLGVMYADNRIMSGIFSDTDRDLLAAFANQAAVAIENARLFRQIRDQLASITEMKYLMDNVFESIASGVITINVEDRISMYNRAAEQILAISPAMAVNNTYHDILSGVSTILNTMVKQVKELGDTRYVEVDTQVENRRGTTSLALNCSPLRDIDNETLGVAIVLDDVTEKKRMESVRRYLPPALVDQVRDIDAAQRPQRQEISILFADVRGFSTFSEYLDPEELIMVINQYFTEASLAITQYQGIIDKFMGDAVMALFNTPLNPQPDHAERAVRAAIAMQDNITKLHINIPEAEQLHLGIGVHTGEAVVGNVGSRMRKDYSALGDAVNLAKRLQEFAKGGQLLISEETYTCVQGWVEIHALKPTRVKGRETLVQIYEVTGAKS